MKKKPDEIILDPKGKPIGVSYTETHPRSLLNRIKNLESKVDQLSKLLQKHAR